MDAGTSFSGYFIKQLKTERHTVEYSQLLEEVRTHFGLSHISYYWICPPAGSRSEKVLLTTYPQRWVKRYLERNYGDRDPVLRFGRRSHLPFDWDDLRCATSLDRSFFDEAENFGVGHSGLSVPIWGYRGEGALFSVTANWEKEAWLDFLDMHLADLSHGALLLHSAVMSNGLPPHSRSAQALSKREVEVLEWAARGKTAWETGQILGLSEKTVYFYLRNAATKLGVNSKTQAVAQATADRFIQL